MSHPLTERWGHVALPLSALSVRSVPFISASAIHGAAVKHKPFTQCWADVGLRR